MSFSSGRESAYEDYLRTIYGHTEWQDDPITPSALAAKLGLAPSTVTEMVKKLAAAGLVNHVRYGAITLTEAGRTKALTVIRRHRIIETWLVAEMGYTWDEVHDEAEVLEHALSDRLLESIARRMGNPTADPHGDLIPDAEGNVPRPDAHSLAGTRVGERVRIVRIRDRDPELLRLLSEHELAPGVVFELRAAAPQLRIAPETGTELRLPAHAADYIWVEAAPAAAPAPAPR